MALPFIYTTRRRQGQPSPPAKTDADSRVKDLRMKRQNRRNRARRLAAIVAKTPKPLSRTVTSRKVRNVTVDLPSVDSQSRDQKQPALRIRRLRIGEAVERKHLAARESGQPPLRIRWLAINEAVEKKRLEARLAAITERTQQHTKRQELRSRRRMQLMCMRMEWNRQQGEKTVAGDELWQQAQESQYGNSQQGNAWPLARWQREQLANEIQAFVRGKR